MTDNDWQVTRTWCVEHGAVRCPQYAGTVMWGTDTNTPKVYVQFHADGRVKMAWSYLKGESAPISTTRTAILAAVEQAREPQTQEQPQ